MNIVLLLLVVMLGINICNDAAQLTRYTLCNGEISANLSQFWVKSGQNF